MAIVHSSGPAPNPAHPTPSVGCRRPWQPRRRPVGSRALADPMLRATQWIDPPKTFGSSWGQEQEHQELEILSGSARSARLDSFAHPSTHSPPRPPPRPGCFPHEAFSGQAARPWGWPVPYVLFLFSVYLVPFLSSAPCSIVLPVRQVLLCLLLTLSAALPVLARPPITPFPTVRHRPARPHTSAAPRVYPQEGNQPPRLRRRIPPLPPLPPPGPQCLDPIHPPPRCRPRRRPRVPH